MKGWGRYENDWLAEVLELHPRPWPDAAVLMWLRHAMTRADRGQPYWVPTWVPGQVSAAAARAERPGRGSVAAVSGLGERKARSLLEGGAWIDPIAAQAAGKGSDEKPAAKPDRVSSKPKEKRTEVRGSEEESALESDRGSNAMYEEQKRLAPVRGSVEESALLRGRTSKAGDPAAALSLHTTVATAGGGGPASVQFDEKTCPASVRGQHQEAAAKLDLESGLCPASAPEGSGLCPASRARDLRAGRPDLPSGLPGDPALSFSPPPRAEQAVEGGAGTSGGGAGPPLAVGAEGVRAAALAIVARARTYQPELPARADRALLRLVREHPADDLVLVLDWAARAPDPEARRIREARRSGVSGSWGPGYALADTWLLDRIARATGWAGAGRPHADDAQLPAEELASRAAAERARALAEDAQRWPGWSPPESWRGLPREYVELHDQAVQAAAMSRSSAAHLARSGAQWVEQCRADGWVDTHPAPPRRKDA